MLSVKKCVNFAMPKAPFRKNGNDIEGRPPFTSCSYNLDWAAFRCNPDKGVWYCKKCRIGGGSFDAAAISLGIINCRTLKNRKITPDEIRIVSEKLQANELPMETDIHGY